MPLDQIDHEPKPTKTRIDEMRMSFGDHIEDLRRRLVLALMGPLIASVLGLVYGRHIVGWLVKPLAQVLQYFDLPPQTYNLAVTTGFGVYMKVGLIVGLILSSPWVVYQLWKFIQSGLYEHERRAAYWVAPFSAVMSVLGVLFLYYVLLPISLAFLIYFTIGYPALDTSGPPQGGIIGWVLSAYPEPNATAITLDPSGISPDEAASQTAYFPVLDKDPEDPGQGQYWIKQPEGQLRFHFNGRTSAIIPRTSGSMLAPMIEIGQYISFVTMMAFAVVISFQLPVVMMILGWTRLIEPSLLSKYRRYCIFACFVLGAILTPADPISMFALAMPLWGLFELGLVVMRMAYGKPKASTDDA